MTTAVSAITCPKCKWTIFSRVHHDMHSCECGGVSIDGGFDYTRVLWHGDLTSPKVFKIVVQPSEKELFEDWNLGKKQYGALPPNAFLVPAPEEPTDETI